MFTLRQETTIWIDDVTVTETPDRSPLSPVAGNLVPNGSFEAGENLCTAARPYWTDGVGFLPILSGAHDAWRIRSVETPWAAHGLRALGFSLAAKRQGIDELDLTSANFPLRFGHPAQVSFWMKASRLGAQLYAAVAHGEHPGTEFQAATFQINTDQWRRYTFGIDVAPSAQGLHFLRLKVTGPGDYWLDGVAVHDAATAPERFAPRALDIGFAPVGTPRVGHLHSPGDDISFRIFASAAPAVDGTPVTSIVLVARVVDLFGAEVLRREFTATAAAAGDRAEATLTDLPRTRFGPYKIELFPATADLAADLPVGEIQYHVFPPLAPLSSVTDRFFSGHASTLGAAELEVCERVGIRSLRFHRPEVTKWQYLQPERDGPFLFADVLPAVARAHALGFDLYGSFDLSSYWDSTYTEGEELGWRGPGAYAPKDWDAYRRYVAESAKVFKPYISTWEVWNEVELQEYFGMSHSWKDGRAKLVEKLVVETRRALDESGSEVKLNGMGAYDLTHKLSDELMAMDLWQHLDGATFHTYAVDVTGLEPRVARLAQELDRSGRPVDIWMSEGANTTRVGSWLRSPRIPGNSASVALQHAAGTLRGMAQFKAMGVTRYYTYPGPYEWANGRAINNNAWSFGDDALANPLPAWSAHAAAVLLLEGATPLPDGAAIQREKLDDTLVTFLRFAHPDGRRVTVAWSLKPVALSAVPALAESHGQYHDLLGNPIAPPAELTLTPVYFTSRP